MAEKTKFEKGIDKFIDDNLELDKALDSLDDEDKPKTYETIKYQEIKSNYPYEQSDEFEDYLFARTTIYETIRSLKFALNNAIKIADESEDPIAYDAVNKLSNSIIQSSKELSNLREKKNFGKEKDAGSGDGSGQQYFEGSKNDVGYFLDDLEDDES